MCRLRLQAVGQAEPGLCGPGQAGPYFQPHTAFGPASYPESLSRRLRPRLLGTKCPNFFEVDIWVLSLRRCTAAAVTRNPGHVMHSFFADDGHASQVLLFPSSASSRQPWTSRGASGAECTPSSSTHPSPVPPPPLCPTIVDQRQQRGIHTSDDEGEREGDDD